MLQDDEKELELFKKWWKTLVQIPEFEFTNFEGYAVSAWLARAKLDNQLHKSSKLNLCCEVFVDEKETSNTD